MQEERPVVFTLSEVSQGVYSLTTKDPRGDLLNEGKVLSHKLVWKMRDLSKRLNNKGYAVLFEVD